MPESIQNALSALSPLDWLIVAAYLLMSLGIGIYFTKRASSSMSSYFVSGRSLPWYILGTSIVATTFAADTPLAITGWIREGGIWKNWFWWNYIFSSVFIVVVFARLWRRAEVITDNELIEIRYSGKPAAFLRGFKAFYFSTLFNFIVMGWVISAMAKVFKVFFGIDTDLAIIICISIAFFYTMMSGLWGVALTDFLQYFIAVIGTVILAWVVIGSPEIGGFSGFIDKLGKIDKEHISFFMTPSGGDPVSEGVLDSSFFAFLVYVTIIWWSSHNADGGGYIIQRINSAKNERHAVLGMAWFAINHYIIRLWPWVLVALATLIIYPRVQEYGGDHEAMYVVVIRDYLGPGLKGLLFVTFLAAFMSTLSTQLNWGASYLMNDIYRRFIKKNASESHYILISRFVTLILTILAGYFAFYITNIGKAWIFLWAMSAGVGLVLILRWFWWRINAWSEISALAASLFTILVLFIYTQANGVSLELKHQILVIPVSIITWIVVTFLTKPESNETLGNFYKRVRPWGWWKPASDQHPQITKPKFMPVIYNWLLGVAFLIFGMIGVGKMLLGSFSFGAICIILSVISGVIVYIRMREELK
ncbi:MAG: sodium:solute symporter family protein [Thermodesulfobacteriota bacterium]